MPNVLKVFLENGQTKSFKYDTKTTVKDVLDSLQAKLSVMRTEHFSLVLQHRKHFHRSKLSILPLSETLSRIAARPGAEHFRILFRITFVPQDACDLAKNDPVAFEYFYTQCCNDVVQDRFSADVKPDVVLRLAALHIQQHALGNNFTGKISIKQVERECGLEHYVPESVLNSMKRKDVRKLVSHYLKVNPNLVPIGQRSLSAEQAKQQYLKIVADLPSFGVKLYNILLRVRYTRRHPKKFVVCI
ncbi:PREDICTED: FERM and PDZ domain-containing protein 4-like [Priapulus caudatus]|uniref:FERM and PDZ domain-containing protein 4-like n=1 Tax=Priapulus caudatus TaxID=37621 RepID=A0ABM1ENJ8_PRICU|nr:PREDICTED: FERM and PDZ domain-containing protein 4-like [Priapulus caudatus]